ncbi:MAG: hypothetical protein NTV67_02920 [Chloroflexi bacterium]|nr:hypothetical protein [Chloroflexota bacterium]
MSSPTHSHRLISAGLALTLLTLAACGAPTRALAPSSNHTGGANAIDAAASIRPITAIAGRLLEPLALAGLTTAPSQIITLESGEVRIEQRLLDSAGLELLSIQSTPSGDLRSISRSNVPLGGAVMSNAALVSRAILHLASLTLPLGSGAPVISAVADRRVVTWGRTVNGVAVPGDGTRVALSVSGALVGIAIDEAPLAPAPARVATVATAKTAALLLVPSGAALSGTPKLGWVAPAIDAGDEEDLSAPRELAWRLRGALADGTPFELHLAAGSLALLGWDWAR